MINTETATLQPLTFSFNIWRRRADGRLLAFIASLQLTNQDDKSPVFELLGQAGAINSEVALKHWGNRAGHAGATEVAAEQNMAHLSTHSAG